MNHPFSSYDPEVGFSQHVTEADAKEAAEESINEYRNLADVQGWPAEVAEVCWGKITEGSSRHQTGNVTIGKETFETVDYSLSAD